MYGLRGSTHLILENHNKALADFDQSIERNPLVCFTYSFRGSLKALQKRYSEAIADWDIALMIDPKFVEVLISWGELFKIMWNLQKAQKDLDSDFDNIRQNSEFIELKRKYEKKAPTFQWGLWGGVYLLFHLSAVPLAQSGLTSLFGMGRGVPRRYYHRNLFSSFRTYGIDSFEEINLFQLWIFNYELWIIN